MEQNKNTVIKCKTSTTEVFLSDYDIKELAKKFRKEVESSYYYDKIVLCKK